MSTMFVEITGEKVMEHKLRRMGKAAVRARPAMRQIAGLLLETERLIFEGQGHRGGGSWKPLTEAWQIRKSNLYLDPRINIANTYLMASMSEPEAPHQILHVGDTRVLLGSDLPYAETAQRNRPYNRLLPSDIEKMRLIITGYITSRFYK